MTDAVASCSKSCVIAALRPGPLILMQPMKASKQSAARVGSKSVSAIIIARCFKADRWTALSKNVWTIHEMHRKSNMTVC